RLPRLALPPEALHRPGSGQLPRALLDLPVRRRVPAEGRHRAGDGLWAHPGAGRQPGGDRHRIGRALLDGAPRRRVAGTPGPGSTAGPSGRGVTAAHEPNPTPTSAPAGETIVPIEDVGERLDRFLMRRFPDRSRSYLQRLVEEGDIMVNEKPSRAGYRLRGGDRIAWRFPARPLPSLEPEEIPLDVV